jgi:signal transduction histidine kinase
METQLNRAEQKLTMIINHASAGMVEIDRSGKIIHLNSNAEALLKPVLIANNLNGDGNNLYAVLEHIAPPIVEKIKSSADDAGNILKNEPYSFFLCFGGEKVERHYNFMVTKVFTDCIIVGFDDITEKWMREKAMVQLASDKAVVQGKYEIAANVLHDIGNAVVGFGSYLTRIKRSLEQTNLDNLKKLAGFLTTQQTAMAGILGDTKAEAVISMLNNITESQKNNQDEIGKSISEQLHIITHIQDILAIQRQYLNGHESLEKTPTNLRSIINDCMAMLLASIEKRSIKVTLNVPEGLPLIKGDRTRLMQVILNILKNSIEAIDITAEEKHITLCVKLTDDVLILQVEDSGTGFDEATGKKLFARGFTTKATGTGLGLSNCRTIIEGHNGTIDIISEGFGKGSVTTIKFKI